MLPKAWVVYVNQQTSTNNKNYRGNFQEGWTVANGLSKTMGLA